MADYNCKLCYPNLVRNYTLSGGGWSPTLPLANLQDWRIQKKARTIGTSAANSQFIAYCATPSVINALALVGHNMSVDAQYRICASNSSDFSSLIYDSGWVDVWPALKTTYNMLFEDFNWWSGKISDTVRKKYPGSVLNIPSTQGGVLANYLRFELVDTGNQDGYIDIGRLFLGRAWSPLVNMEQGKTSLGWESRTETQESWGGSKYSFVKPGRRVASFNLPDMSVDESLEGPFDMMTLIGLSNDEAFFVFNPDPAQTKHWSRWSFLCNLKTLNPIGFDGYNQNSVTLEIEEVI